MPKFDVVTSVTLMLANRVEAKDVEEARRIVEMASVRDVVREARDYDVHDFSILGTFNEKGNRVYLDGQEDPDPKG